VPSGVPYRHTTVHAVPISHAGYSIARYLHFPGTGAHFHYFDQGHPVTPPLPYAAVWTIVHAFRFENFGDTPYLQTTRAAIHLTFTQQRRRAVRGNDCGRLRGNIMLLTITGASLCRCAPAHSWRPTPRCRFSLPFAHPSVTTFLPATGAADARLHSLSIHTLLDANSLLLPAFLHLQAFTWPFITAAWRYTLGRFLVPFLQNALHTALPPPPHLLRLPSPTTSYLAGLGGKRHLIH